MKKIFKSLIVGFIAVILVTVGIDAADNYDNFSESMIGRIVFGEGEGPCPKGMVFVPTDTQGFCIDMYEASPGDSCPEIQVLNQLHSRDNINWSDCSAVSKAGRIPWRFVSQTQAQTACAKAGKRLPTDEEWYLASLGTPDKSNDWLDSDCHVDSNWSDQPGVTGSGAACVSSYGAYDMIGNVWEWVKGEVRDGVYNDEVLPKSGYITAVDSQGMPLEIDELEANENYNNDYFWLKDKGVRGFARGGYWDNKEGAGVYAMYLVSPPSFAGTGIGFRCAK